MAYTISRKGQDRKGYSKPRMLSKVDLGYTKKVEPPNKAKAPLPYEVAMAPEPDIVVERDNSLPSVDQVLAESGIVGSVKKLFKRR